MNKKNNKKFKSKNNIIFIVMIALSISIILGTGAYAYYQSTIAGNVSGTIAKWSFKANNQTESFNLDFGSLYPGKTGTYNIELSAEDSDLDVYYELVFNDYSHPYYLNTYFDLDYQKLIADSGYAGKYGTIPAGQTISIPLYINWPYDANNNGHEYTNSYSAKINIIAQQLTGYSNEIPMYLATFPSGTTATYTDGYITVKQEK